MIELTACQREDGNLQLPQFLVGYQWIGTQRTAKFRIKVVFPELGFFCPTLFHQQFNCLVAQQPDADIRQIEMLFLQFAKGLHRGFLQHVFQYGRCLTAADEYPMVLGH